MARNNSLNVLILAPYCDSGAVGESWSTYQWISGLTKLCEITVLTLRRRRSTSLSEQLPGVEVIEWRDFYIFDRFERFNRMAKPGYLKFYLRSRKWIREAMSMGRRFDLIHQLSPLALRYPSPGTGFGIPLIVGPLAGSLETPAAFVTECHSAPWYVHLRKFDTLRFRYDPWLRATFTSADVVIGVAPYVRELLEDLPIKRFELASETGIHDLAPARSLQSRVPGSLHMLYVGRVIRTKGLRDIIRALAALKDMPLVTLDVAGDGEDLPLCRQEAERLGVGDRIRFLGRVPREQVEKLYAAADVFVFPSFREPSGNVVFESMRHGLPVITTDRGGPGFVVDDESGIRIPVINPTQFASDIARAIRALVEDQSLLERLSTGALKRVRSVGLWEEKVRWMFNLYQDVLGGRRYRTREVVRY